MSTRTDSFDYIVVGAGSAGCVLANRLSAQPDCSVLLLEAGGSDRHPMIRMPLAWMTASMSPAFGWGYATEPEPYADNRKLPQPRGKLMGGTSSINGMMYTRGQAADYDSWKLPGWSYAEVLPYFRRSENHWRGASTLHGASGPLTVSKLAPDSYVYPRMITAAQALGQREIEDFNSPDNEGFGLPDFTIHRGHRGSTSARFIDPVARRPNLRIETGACASRVLLQGERAVGIEYLKDGQRRTAHAAREVILCGGAFNSPQLLLLSGIGPADELRAAGIEPKLDLPGVGRNLHDHPMVLAVYRAAGTYTFDKELRLDRLALSAARWALFRSGPMSGMPFSVQGFFRSAPEVERADAQFQVSHVSYFARPWFPGWRRGAGHEVSAGCLLLRPESRGSVRLRSNNPTDAPRLRYNLLQAEADRCGLRNMLRFMRQFFATKSGTELVAGELFPGSAVASDADIDAFLHANAGTGMHPVGSCAMGAGPEAVVDVELRVRGISGLRVADASIIPSIVSGNTNAPAIMIAEKAADLILAPAEALATPHRAAA